MKVKRFTWFVLATVTLTAAPALAQQHVELTPFGGYRFGGSFNVDDGAGSYDVDDSTSVGLILNWRHRDNTRWEIYYSQQATDASFDAATINDPELDIETHLLQVGGTYQGDGATWQPFLAATLGGTHIEVTSRGSESDTFLSGSIGVGLLFRPESRLGMRLEVRGHGTLVNSDTDLFCETGPTANVCALRIAGDVLWQIDAFAGVVFRF